MHRTNRYRKPEKRAAYEEALNLAAGLQDLDNLATAEIALIVATRHKLNTIDARQVAAKAVRVERGYRVLQRRVK